MTGTAIAANGLVKRLHQSVAIDGVQFTMPAGQLWGVLSARQGGRTTLMRLIAGVMKPNGGEIRVFGFDPIRHVREFQRIIGYVPENAGIYDDLTVRENIRLHADLREITRAEWPASLDDVLTSTDLHSVVDQRPDGLSMGTRRRVALACALIGKPRLLLLDELTYGLDPATRRSLMHVLRGFVARGGSTLLTTSYVDEAEHCDAVIFLNHGRLIAIGPPRELVLQSGGSSADLGDIFIGAVSNDGTAPPPLQLRRTKPPLSQPALEVSGLTLEDADRMLLEAIDLTVMGGQITGLTGPAGAGKSLFLRLLCGVARPTRGQVAVAGIDLQRAPRAAKARLGLIDSMAAPYPELTAAQTLFFFASARGLAAERRQRISGTLGEFGLGPVADRRSGALPPTFQWRLALAAALIHAPDLLLIDEPVSDLDPVMRQLLWDDIAVVASCGIAVMAASHLAEDEKHCDVVLRLEGGRLVAKGPPHIVLTAALERAHGTPPQHEPAR